MQFLGLEDLTNLLEAFKRQYILYNFIHKIWAAAEKGKQQQNIQYLFYHSPHINLQWGERQRQREREREERNFLLG
jgi:hypothetical protein